jgi:magnesium-transporting ATPase (P-type)
MRALTGEDAAVICMRSSSSSNSSSNNSSSSSSSSICWQSVRQSELVPGDLIQVAPACTIPADCIIVTGSVLVDESMLTGESLPLSKIAPEVFDSRLYDPATMKKCSLFSGALCKDSRGASGGHATAIVTRTGMFSNKGEMQTGLCRHVTSHACVVYSFAGVLLQALLLPLEFQPPYKREASFFLFLMFLYSLWNFAVTQRLVQVDNSIHVTCDV